MSTTTRRQLDQKALQSIIAKRAIIKITDVGSTLRFHVQGNGNIIAVTKKDGTPAESAANPGTQLMKRIYNIKANSQVAMLNDRNRDILRQGAIAEHEEDFEAAHNAYNDYLNKVQVSFGVLLPSKHDFSDGQLIEGEIALVETDKGQLLTIENPRAVAVAKAAATPAFTLADLLGVEKVEDVFTPATGAEAGAQA